jgi:branched-chain amino acid transport system ATP-binding protein
MKTAIDIIKSEHRALAAMLSGLSAFVDGIAAGKFEPDFTLLAAMIEYIGEVPEKVHHPKEDDYLFPALRKRSASAAAIIDDLQGEHHIGPANLAALTTSLDNYRTAGAAGLPAFRDAVKAYVDFQWQHMSKEEKHVLPLARDVLTAEDWAAIDGVFAANDNPWEGPAGEYKQLFTRIVSIAPDPIGVGDRSPSHREGAQ